MGGLAIASLALVLYFGPFNDVLLREHAKLKEQERLKATEIAVSDLSASTQKFISARPKVERAQLVRLLLGVLVCLCVAFVYIVFSMGNARQAMQAKLLGVRAVGKS